MELAVTRAAVRAASSRKIPTARAPIPTASTGIFRSPCQTVTMACLFGASRADVAARMSDLAPLFADPNISLDDARTRARRYNIDAMIVTALDPAFTAAKWTSELKPAYANAHVRIYAFTERLHAP